MSAARSLPTAVAIASLDEPSYDDVFEDVRPIAIAYEEEERLPRGIAYAIILLMSVACWGLIATVGLWLWQVLG